jgi:hypothetical protein
VRLRYDDTQGGPPKSEVTSGDNLTGIEVQLQQAVELRDKLGGFTDVKLDTRKGTHWFMVHVSGYDARIDVEFDDPR